MTADIVPFPEPKRKLPRRWGPQRFMVGVEAALNMLSGVLEDLEPYKGVRIKRAVFLVNMVIETLEKSRVLYVEDARLDVNEAMLAALGPGLRVDGLDGARRALEMVLDCLPEVPK